MWVFLLELGVWVLLVSFVVGALLWFGPFLLLRRIWDTLTGKRGVVERALDNRVNEQLASLKRFSGSELVKHPDHGITRPVVIAGRRARFVWRTSPNFDDPPGIDVVLEHELYLFNIAIAPRTHGVNGFKIKSTGECIDMTPAEEAEYD